MQKKIVVALITILAIAIGVGGVLAYRYWTTPQEEAPMLIGGDKDAGGCLIGAGYSWCEAKQKCLRVFEEDCLSVEGITSALALKHNKQASEVFIEIDNENTKYARGNVRYETTEGEAGMFMAVKNEKWEIVFDGNGGVDCERIKQSYQFPAEMLIGFCD